MSLRVWLPLTKDLRNQGLDNVTVTNNGATFNSEGKLGGCYSFNGSSQKIVNTLPSAVTSSVGSLSCWVKMNSLPSSSGFYNLMQLGNLGGYATCRLGLYMEYTNKINISIDGSSTGGNVYTHSLVANQWYHICATYDGTIVKLYIDGNEVFSKTALKRSYTTAASYLYVGGTSSYYLNGYMNDARYYDHCLSPMEVKQISQGLILHYPLNRQGFGQENLLKDSHVSVNTSSYAMHDYYFVTGEEPIEGETYTIQIKGQLGEGKKYFSPYNSGGSVSQITLYPSSQKNGIYTGTFSWRKGTASNTFLRVYHMNSSTVVASTIEWVKLEKGETATPWCPNHTDELYTTMGLDSNIEYDTSGYCHNGQYYSYDSYGSITYSSDTPKYSVSLHLDNDAKNISSNTKEGTKYIYGSCPLVTPNQLTVAFWCKPIAGYYGGAGQGHFCTVGHPYGDPNVASDYTRTCFHQRDSGIDFCSSDDVCDRVNIPFVASEWHHYTVVYDGQVTRVYRDGEEKFSKGFDTAKSLTSMLGVVIGYSFAGGAYRSNNSYYSDFRIYATALSPSDVKSLYQNCATIDPDGTIRGQIRS